MKLYYLLVFLGFIVLQQALELDEITEKALALAQKKDKKKDKKGKKGGKKGKDKGKGKGKKGGKGGKGAKGGKGGKADKGGGDDGGDDGDDEGGEPEKEDPLVYASLMAMLDELSETVMENLEQNSEIILDRVKTIEEETREFYQQLRDSFYEHIQQATILGRQIISGLRDKINENQRKMFELTELLIDRILEQKTREIREFKDQIQMELEKFPPPPSACDYLHSCDDCLNRLNCVWCSETHRCHEGNRKDGMFFHLCDFTLVGSCETPKSELFVELPPEPEIQSPLEHYLQMPDMPVAQKNYIATKQQEMIDLKNKITLRRLQIWQMENLTISIRAKRIKLIFQMVHLQKQKERGIIDDEINDYDPEDFFLDQIDIDESDVGLAIQKLEEEVREMKEEDEQQAKEREEERIQQQEEELARKRDAYENQGRGSRGGGGGGKSGSGGGKGKQGRGQKGSGQGGLPQGRGSRRREEKPDPLDQKSYKRNEPLGSVIDQETKRKAEEAKEEKKTKAKFYYFI